MQFSVNYKSKHKQEADEIRCPINQIGLLFDFIKQNPEKRYNIVFSKNIELQQATNQLSLLKNVTENFTVQCDSISIFHSMREEGFPAFLRFPVTDWETFSNLKDIASDIYIDGPLGFSANLVKSGKGDCKIRVSPTISPNASLVTSANANSFFIRPEDLHLYKDVIDIIDFNEPEQEKEDVLFTIYKRGTFDFDLQELVRTLHTRIPNIFFTTPKFSEARLNCEQKCRKPNRSCHICTSYVNLVNKIIEHLNHSS